jgi:hypothetical protein
MDTINRSEDINDDRSHLLGAAAVAVAAAGTTVET